MNQTKKAESEVNNMNKTYARVNPKTLRGEYSNEATFTETE